MVIEVESSSNAQHSPKIQIIRRKIDPKLLTGRYYGRVKNSIRRNIRDDADILMIQLIPKTPISEKWVLESFLALQREFTPILIQPHNTVNMKEEEIKEFEDIFKASAIMIGL